MVSHYTLLLQLEQEESCMASEKQITDCYWFLQGQCAKGEACEYRHQPEALQTTTTCAAWTEGKCKNIACILRHPSGAQPKARGNVVCYYFTHGGCMKGSSCPFSHNVEIPEDQNNDSAVKQLEEMKKKQADELKRLQEERKKEEERLAHLRAQQELLQREQQKKKQQEDSQKNERQKNQLKKQMGNRAKSGQTTSSDKPAVQVLPSSQSTFSRSLSDIIKDKKQSRNDNKRPIKEKLEPKKKQDSKNEPQNLDFGVKSLDQLLKEKQEKEKQENEKPVVSEKQESDKVDSPNLDSKKSPSLRVAELRKKNEKKFKPPVTQSAPKTNDSPSTTISSLPTTTSKEIPKRGRETPASPKVEPQHKKSKVVEPPKTTSTSEEPDFNDDLAELGIELGDTDTIEGQEDFDEDLDAIINS